GTGPLRVEEIAWGKQGLEGTFPRLDGRGLAVSADGEYLAVATMRQFFLWKWREEEPRLLAGLPRVDGMSFSPGGPFLAVVSRSPNRLYMLEIPSGRVAYQREFAGTDVWPPLFTPDGKNLLVPRHRYETDEWKTEILDPKDGERKGFVPVGGRVMAVSPDSRFVASGFGQSLRICDLTTGTELS